jgi:outer membrane immunogenic protein
MKKITTGIAAIAALLGTQAWAADMAVKAPPKPLPPSLPLWTGFYLGVNGGCGWSKSPTPSNYAVDGAEDNGVFTSETKSGCFGGGQVGYIYQFSNNVVIGLEADAAWANIGSSFLWNQGNGDDINLWSSKLDSFGTVRARLGYAFDRWLPYITGGWAWGHNKISSYCSVIDSPSCDPAGAAMSSSDAQTHSGWAIGAGVE